MTVTFSEQADPSPRQRVAPRGTAPTFGQYAFSCPYCGAFAEQEWETAHTEVAFRGQKGQKPIEQFHVSRCKLCFEVALWWDQNMIFPDRSGVSPPNPDLDTAIRNDYLEAAAIVNRSPRGAAALLRLCIQKVCKQLGEDGQSINSDIASLVKKGLPVMIQQALDVVRVTGNDAVHPGEIDLRDDRDAALTLFQLVNLIADAMITQPKQVQALYDSLPASKRQAIEVRDKSSKTSNS